VPSTVPPFDSTIEWRHLSNCCRDLSSPMHSRIRRLLVVRTLTHDIGIRAAP
jgi:hypothetical protein